MNQRELHKDFSLLVQLGLGQSVDALISIEDWPALQALAMEQGLYAIVLDGIEKLPASARPPQEFLLEWIGMVMQDEERYAVQQKAARKMADLFSKNYIRTYVLKGEVVAECYPKPEHRVSSDMDCFLLSVKGQFDAWALGNNLVKAQGYKVSTGFYKNSTFFYPDLSVENHQYMVPFRGNERLKELEKLLQSQLKVLALRGCSGDKSEDSLKLKDSSEVNGRKKEGTWLYRPPVMVTALFLIEHAYSHFLHEGLTWRHVLDWMMFSRKHKDEIDWNALDALIDEFSFRKFYDSYYRLGKFLLGETQEEELNKIDRKMLADVWAPLDLHESVRGWKGKLRLAGNTWRARWKYHYFSDISMLHALWIQVKGVLFEKCPKLN